MIQGRPDACPAPPIGAAFLSTDGRSASPPIALSADISGVGAKPSPSASSSSRAASRLLDTAS